MGPDHPAMPHTLQMLLLFSRRFRYVLKNIA
jgi:hypothetical protein